MFLFCLKGLPGRRGMQGAQGDPGADVSCALFEILLSYIALHHQIM